MDQIAVGLPGKHESLHTASKCLKLRGAPQVVVEIRWQFIRARDGKNWRTCYPLDAFLHRRVARRRVGPRENLLRVGPACESDPCCREKFKGDWRIPGH